MTLSAVIAVRFTQRANTITHKVANMNMKNFEYQHLPPHLQEISKPIGELAIAMNESLPDGEEKEIGLRKLLEAKDCLVRSKLGN